MPTEKAKNNQVGSRKKLKTVLIVTCGLVLLVLFDMFTPIWGGQIKFYAKWIECGQAPQQEPNGIAPQYVKSYERAPTISIWRDNHMIYFCTPIEAELEGYSSNSDFYDFPHLTQQERNAM